MKIFIASFFAFILASPAAAEFQSGNDLQAMCSSDKITDMAFCLGYIRGTLDGALLDNLFFSKTVGETTYNPNLAPGRFCLPKNVTIGQNKDIILRFLQENPKQRHLSASNILLMAIKESWPCSD